MRKHRWLATSMGLALLFTTAVSTTYAQGANQQSQNGFQNLICRIIPQWCNTGGGGGGGNGGPPSPAATPELDSLLLFGVGLSGLGGYAVTRFRARRRS
jgi:hypothetical protein